MAKPGSWIKEHPVKRAAEVFDRIESELIEQSPEQTIIDELLEEGHKPCDDAIRSQWPEYYKLMDERDILLAQGAKEEHLEKPLRPRWAKPSIERKAHLTQRPFVNPDLQRLKKELAT